MYIKIPPTTKNKPKKDKHIIFYDLVSKQYCTKNTLRCMKIDALLNNISYEPILLKYSGLSRIDKGLLFDCTIVHNVDNLFSMIKDQFNSEIYIL